MTELKDFAAELIKRIVPNFDKLEFRATIGDTSRSLEFFVTVGGERKQCYELVDEGVISEDDLDEAFAEIAAFIRRGADYQKGRVNKVSFESDEERPRPVF